MNKSQTFLLIKKRQRLWAQSRGISINSNDRVFRLEDNLFAPLNSETRQEFEAGDGGEFGTANAVGKIHSLYSSSALVCNFFDYWRGHSLSPLIADIRFEQKFPTGVGRKPARANLDLIFNHSSAGCLPTAVESKFTEPFQPGECDCLVPSYFSTADVWKELPACRNIAASLPDPKRFECLKPGQLLKHILGLTRAFGKKKFSFLYLWYDVQGSNAADKHRDEIVDFRNLVTEEVLFDSETYQSLFKRLCRVASGTAYENYLRMRYFSQLLGGE